MIEHTFKCKYNPDGVHELKCEVCEKGGFFMLKRILAHKRKAHGWDFEDDCFLISVYISVSVFVDK